MEENAGAPVEDPGYEAAFAGWFDAEAHQRVSWLAEQDGEAVGMVNLAVFTRMPRPGSPATRWGYVANVYVVPPARDSGVGTRLMDAVTRHADEQGFVRLVLSPSERSVPLYLRAGFAPATALLLRPGR